LIKRFMGAFNARDAELAASLTADHAEIVPLRAAVEGHAYRGGDGVREWFKDSDEQWEGLHMHVDRVERSGDRALVVGHLRARSKDSGALADNKLAILVRIEGGLVAGARSYPDPEEAEAEFRRMDPLAERLVRNLNSGDADATAADFAHDAEIVPMRAAVDGTTFKGPRAIHDFFAAMDETWSELEWRDARSRRTGDRLLIVGHLRATSRESGANADNRIGIVFDLRDELVVRAVTYPDPSEAEAEFHRGHPCPRSDAEGDVLSP
jgi:ketosteroid isomerase-like protein